MNKLTMNAIRAMVWKEWRENAPWALLGMIGLSLGILYNVTVKAGTFYYHVQGFASFWPGLYAAMAVSCCLIAAAMGLLQILPEQRRDQWAFLVHRPATPGVLFWGKTIAGLSLYLIAVLIPFLATAVWAAVPGHLAAPFDARLLLPGLASVFAGGVAYFGAMITALRPARWYGARALPVLAALVTAFLPTAGGTEFVIVLGISALFLVVFGVAAWSVFGADANGARGASIGTRGAVVGKICVAVVLYLAFAELYGAVFGFTGNIYSEMTSRHRNAQYEQSSYEQYGVSQSGQIVRARYQRHWSPSGGYTADLSAIYNLSGKSLPIGDNGNYDIGLYEWPTTIQTNHEWLSYTNPERYARSMNAYAEVNTPSLVWYYLPSDHRIAIYENRSRRFVGLFGANGFRAPGASKPAPFAGEPIGQPLPYPGNRIEDSFGSQAIPPLVYAFDHTLYRLDAFDDRGRFLPLSRRTMTPIFQTAANNAISSVMPIRLSGDGFNSFVVTTPQGMEVIDWQGTSHLSIPWAPGENNRDTKVDLAVAAGSKHGPAKFLFLFSPWQGGAKRPIRALVVEPGGKVLQQAMVTEGDWFPVAPAPTAYGVIAPVFSLPLAVPSVGRAGARRMTFIALSLTVSLVWAALAFCVGVRCAVAPRVRLGWAALAFVFGLPGLLTFLALAPWPARIVCPVCGKRRAVTHESCEHCGAAFPPPPRDGTEIFEDPVRIVRAA